MENEPDDCDHGVLVLRDYGVWKESAYVDWYECPGCGAVFYEKFSADGFYTEDDEEFELEGRELTGQYYDAE